MRLLQKTDLAVKECNLISISHFRHVMGYAAVITRTTPLAAHSIFACNFLQDFHDYVCGFL